MCSIVMALKKTILKIFYLKFIMKIVLLLFTSFLLSCHLFGNDTQPSCQENDFTDNVSNEEGEWLPEMSPFFPTMLAQPHLIGYSAGYRTYDKVFKTSCLPVSIGDQFSLYQIKTPYDGQLFFGIEACVWAVFEAKTKSLSLLNADYYVAFPLTYINNSFSMRLRLFHESSHLGDEYMLDHPEIFRLNPSMEVLDMSFAYSFEETLTTFIGISKVLRSDDSFRIKPYTIYYGFNYYLDFITFKICNLDATPYIATYFANLEEKNWRLDSSIAIGYQWNKLYGHKLRLYAEAHDGVSHEGQFSKQKTRYIAFKILYGY